eukprot:365367-Chlamydomonas_euryale.AAC.2
MEPRAMMPAGRASMVTLVVTRSRRVDTPSALLRWRCSSLSGEERQRSAAPRQRSAATEEQLWHRKEGCAWADAEGAAKLRDHFERGVTIEALAAGIIARGFIGATADQWAELLQFPTLPAERQRVMLAGALTAVQDVGGGQMAAARATAAAAGTPAEETRLPPPPPSPSRLSLSLVRRARSGWWPSASLTHRIVPQTAASALPPPTPRTAPLGAARGLRCRRKAGNSGAGA